MGSVSICRVFKCELPAQVFRCDSFPQRLINNKALMYSRAKSMHGMIAVLCNLPGIFITNAEMYFIHSYTRTGIFFSTQNGGISVTVRGTRELEFVRETSGTGCQI